MVKKKIIFLCPFPYGVQAGQRFKFEQHIKALEKENIQVDFNSFFSIKMWNIMYKKGNIIKKIYYTSLSYIRRYLLLFKINNYDTVYLFLWGTPFFDTLFEKLLIKKNIKLIYDIEDNIFVLKKNKINPITYYIKSNKKYFILIKAADSIITSSKELEKICENYSNKKNCYFIPPTIFNFINIKHKSYIKKDKITIGWTGTFSSVSYLSIVESVIEKLKKKYDIIFLVISNQKYENKNFQVRYIEWSKKNELNDLIKIDIGIYPVNDEEWSYGKSGLKALQYMGLGIPTVASDILTTRDIIKNKHDGILVKNDYESWYFALESLIIDNQLRRNIGVNGFNKVSEFYSKHAIRKKYFKLLLS